MTPAPDPAAVAGGRRLLQATIAGRRGSVAASALLLGAHQGFEALVPVVVGATLDAAVEPSDTGALLLWLGILAGLFLLLANAYRWGARINTAALERAAHGLRMDLVRRVLDPRGGGEGGRLPGELLSVSTTDVDATAKVIRALGFATGVLVALAVGAVVLLSISLLLGLLVLVGLPAVLWVAGRLAAPLERRAAGQQASFADAAGVAADLVGGHRVLQGLGATDAAAQRYERASRASLRATIGAARAEAVVWGSANLVGGVALAVVALVGGRLATDGDISIGQLIAAVGVTQFLVGPLERLAWVGSLWARARASSVRLAAALAVPPAVGGDRSTGDLAPATPVGLRVHGLDHGPLRGVELDVAPGSVHGVVGEPAVAQALLDVLGQESRAGAGSVLLTTGSATTDLDATRPADARRLVVVSPHDATLLADTVRANVEVVAGGDAARVRTALAAARADELADVLPDGLDTVLADDGASLSGGQRQRVALARALATDAPVLVLHDPTTALDAATEAGVAAALRTARRGRTTLLVVTSPALLAVCDTVSVIRDGTTVAAGSHEALVAGDVGYRDTVLA